MSGSNVDRADTSPIVTVIVLCRERYGLTESVIDQIAHQYAGAAHLCRCRDARRATGEDRRSLGGMGLGGDPLRRTPLAIAGEATHCRIDRYEIRGVHRQRHARSARVARAARRMRRGDRRRAGRPALSLGDSGRSERVHMAGGELTTTSDARGILLYERHRHVNKQASELELKRGPCDFVEFHCMLMRRELYQAPGMFDETIVCVHEHIHAALLCREMGYSICMEPSSRVVYLAYVPYALADLDPFRWRWSFEAAMSTIAAFAKRWGSSTMTARSA